ncbi:MAG TPA: GNAT family N-acetyltransferase [Desulfobulbus sp.]|nr:GNAT family N-acetyltransferase [Desulfobulbus sp.]
METIQPGDIRVRHAEPADLGAMVGLLQILFTIEEDFVFDAAKARQGLLLLLEADRAAVLVAEQDGLVIGMCTGQVVISTAEGGPAVLVEDVVVLPGMRGRGAGRMLLDALAAWSAGQGAARMQILADRNNDGGIAFYLRTGWRSTRLICLRRRETGS